MQHCHPQDYKLHDHSVSRVLFGRLDSDKVQLGYHCCVKNNLQSLKKKKASQKPETYDPCMTVPLSMGRRLDVIERCLYVPLAFFFIKALNKSC